LPFVCASREVGDVAKGGRILERRSGDLEDWIARAAEGNPVAVSM